MLFFLVLIVIFAYMAQEAHIQSQRYGKRTIDDLDEALLKDEKRIKRMMKGGE